MDSLTPIWPASRTQIDGVPLGDAWPCSVMPYHPTHPWENIVPFHKLTQWLTYSLMVPMTKLLNVHFAGADLLTGLPEYRNGGLFVDTGLLTLKPEDAKRGLAQYQRNAQVKGQPNMEVVPLFTADDDVIVEWRAVTVGFLDELLTEVNALLGLTGREKLSLAQMLEAGSWKVSHPHPRVMAQQLTWLVGRTRDRRSITAEHQRTADHDPVRWHRFLRYPRSLFLLPLLCPFPPFIVHVYDVVPKHVAVPHARIIILCPLNAESRVRVRLPSTAETGIYIPMFIFVALPNSYTKPIRACTRHLPCLAQVPTYSIFTDLPLVSTFRFRRPFCFFWIQWHFKTKTSNRI